PNRLPRSPLQPAPPPRRRPGPGAAQPDGTACRLAPSAPARPTSCSLLRGASRGRNTTLCLHHTSAMTMTMVHQAAAGTISKADVLALFRRCLRSMQNMPDPGQRASYLIYVRDAFGRRAKLPPQSKEALLAYRDGIDQVKQMEYYHAEMRRRRSENNEASREARSTTMDAEPKSAESDPDTSAEAEIAKWLLRYLPHLNRENARMYSQALVSDGFDSVAFIEEELTVEDLSFMKRAHRRVIERQIRTWSKDAKKT
ncbi:hypothetical protein ACHAWF_005101, partial [Thalassiosira exigua]